MKKINEIIDEITNGSCDGDFLDIYVDKEKVRYNKLRYLKAIKKFQDIFGEKEIAIFSAPGRSEVCGNHTDHQNGHVLATSINLDAIAVVAPRKDGRIKLVSEDSDMYVLSMDELGMQEEEKNATMALIRGVAYGIQKLGKNIGGFEAYVTSDVLIGAGMSSSAAFESLLGAIFSGLYNEGELSSVEIAKIGQYAENVYFGKPCGLMDQMACSVGGLVYIDFKKENKVTMKQVPFDLEKNQYSLCIVDTQGSHADLTDDYAAIPEEMHQVAAHFHKEKLREVEPERFFGEIRAIRKEMGDRAVLRGMHFFEEQQRVNTCVKTLEMDDFKGFLQSVKESGDSSAKLLQNIYSNKDVQTQDVTVALAMSEYILQDNGVCRIHGGGFAGTIQAFVKNDFVQEYKERIEEVLGAGTCQILKVRRQGQMQVF